METRKTNLEELNNEQLLNKRKDILLCIKSCRKDLLDTYNEQLDHLDGIVATRKRLQDNLDRFPCCDEQSDFIY